MSKKKIEDLDLYGILDIQITATEAEVSLKNKVNVVFIK